MSVDPSVNDSKLPEKPKEKTPEELKKEEIEAKKDEALKEAQPVDLGEVLLDVEKEDINVKGSTDSNAKGWDKEWATAFYGGIQSDHTKLLAKYMSHSEFFVLFNNVSIPSDKKEEKDRDKYLIFSEPNWTKAKLIHGELGALQWDYLHDKKVRIDEITKNSGLTLKTYIDKNIPLPENYSNMFAEKAKLEKELYLEAAQIAFKIKLEGKDTRPFTVEDYKRCHLDQLKLAVDVIMFRYENPLVKKART